MTTTLKNTNSTVSPTYGAIPSTAISGQFLTAASNGTSYTTAWAQPNNNFVSNNGKAVMTIPADGQKVILEKEATLEVKGNVVINGIDLEERLKTIEKLLTIPERDVILEKKHPKLKKLYDEYIAALGKYRTFEAIKGDEDGTA